MEKNDKNIDQVLYNQPLFESMARFEDAVWMIDLETQQGFIMHDRFTPSRLGMTVPLDYLLDIIYTSSNPFDAREMATHFTLEALSSLKDIEEYTSPSFMVNGEYHKLRYTLTPSRGPRGIVTRVFVTFMDVQAMLDMQQNAERQKQLYQSISHITSHAKSIDEGVNRALAIIGQYAGVSRVYIFENEENEDFSSNTFEWCNDGIAHCADKLQHVSYDEYGYKELFTDNRFLCITDVNKLPEKQRKFFEMRDIKAVMNYAFYDDDRFMGYIGLDCCVRTRPEWTNNSSDQQMLTFASDLLLTYLIKERHLQRIISARERELQQHAIVRALSEDYLLIALSNPETGMMRALKVHEELMSIFPDVNREEEYPHDQIYHQYAELRVHPDDRHGFLRYLSVKNIKAELKRKSTFHYNYRIINTKGEVHYFRSRHQRLEGGCEFISAYRCIDEIIHYEQENRRIQEEAHAAQEYAEKTQLFMSNMSHEFRTPLNAIVGFSELLCDDEGMALMSKDEKNEISHLVRKNSSLLMTLVNDVLDISSAESGRMKMTFRRVNCAELFKGAVAAVRESYKETTRAEFRLEGCPDEYFMVTDPQRLSQVLYNLLSNAAKNTPEGSIVVGGSPSPEEGVMHFWVKDTGCGIPAENAELIFDRFEKLDPFKQGTGLGLAISRAILERLGGRIWLDTDYTDGALFHFTHAIDLHVEQNQVIRM